jgi:hypothetical protein
MHERFRLPPDGGGDPGMGMTETANGDARGHIEILPAIGVPDPGARAPDQRQGKPLVGVHYIFFVKTRYFIGFHRFSPS